MVVHPAADRDRRQRRVPLPDLAAARQRGRRAVAAVPPGDGTILAMNTPEHSLLGNAADYRSEEHTPDPPSQMRISYAAFFLKKKKIALYPKTLNMQSYKPQQK